MDYFYTFTKNYLNNLNPLWLFTDQIVTPTVNFNIPNFGLFYLFELPLLLLGFYFVIKKSFFSTKTLGLLILWLFVGIMPSAFTIDSPQAIRTLQLLPVYLIIQAAGLFFLLSCIRDIKSKLGKIISYAAAFSIIAISILWFNHAYFVNFTRENSSKFEYGLIQALQYAKNQQGNYSKILISNEGNSIRSSTYYLFTEKYDPLKYQEMGGSESGYYAQTHKFGKYLFTGPNFYYKDGDKEIVTPEFFAKDMEKTLYIISPSECPQSKLNSLGKKYFTLQERIKYLDGTDALWVLTKI